MRIDSRLQELKGLISKVIVKGEVVLSSGRKSNFYIDGRQVSLNSHGSFLIGSLIFEFMRDNHFSAIAGLSIGADPIIAAVLCVAGNNNKSIQGLIIRKEPKTHGKRKQIEGPEVDKGERILLVDDVATTGGSILKAAEALRLAGYNNVDTALVLVDRQEGAEERLKEAGINLLSLFKKSDFI